MPGINPIKILGNLKFLSHQLKLPVEWKSANSIKDEAQQVDSSHLQAVPQLIPPWFMPAEIPNKYAQESCDKVGQGFKDMHDTMLDAISLALVQWKLQASFKDLKVNALVALGTPGCLDGPDLANLIKQSPMVASWTGNKAKYRDAIATGVGKAFKNWADQVTIPGLPLYPAFVFFPGPMAPPMPNIPVPLIACVSPKVTDLLLPNTMKSEMIDAFDSELKKQDKSKQHEALFDALSLVLSICFAIWLPSQMMMLVLGKGQVPSFAPPVVPGGPVVMGDNVPKVPNVIT